MKKIEQQLADKAREMYVPHEFGARAVARKLGVTRNFVENAVGVRTNQADRDRQRRKRGKTLSQAAREREIEHQKNATRSEVCWYARQVAPGNVQLVRERVEALQSQPDFWWRERHSWSVESWYQWLLRAAA